MTDPTREHSDDDRWNEAFRMYVVGSGRGSMYEGYGYGDGMCGVDGDGSSAFRQSASMADPTREADNIGRGDTATESEGGGYGGGEGARFSGRIFEEFDCVFDSGGFGGGHEPGYGRGFGDRFGNGPHPLYRTT